MICINSNIKNNISPYLMTCQIVNKTSIYYKISPYLHELDEIFMRVGGFEL